MKRMLFGSTLALALLSASLMYARKDPALTVRPEAALVRLDFFVSTKQPKHRTWKVYLLQDSRSDLIVKELKKGEINRRGFRHVVLNCYLTAGDHHLLEFRNTVAMMGDRDEFDDQWYVHLRETFTIARDDYGKEVPLGEIIITNGPPRVMSSRLKPME